MSENQRRILEMLSEKKITVEEAERLLSLAGTGSEKGDTKPGAGTERKGLPKYFRVVVQPGPDSSHAEKVNIRVPFSLIRAGVKFKSLIPDEAAAKVQDALKEKGIDFDLRKIKDEDIEGLIQAIGELEVDVDTEGGEKVRVSVE